MKTEMSENSVEKKDFYLNTFSQNEIAQCMQTKWAGKKIVFFEETGSTNMEAMRLAFEGYPHGTLVLADSQTGGKGRRGRSWHTPKGSSVAMSFILKPELEAEYASMLTLVQAMAVAKVIEENCGLKAQIKWPNDIVVNNKKVCGILTEMYPDADGKYFVIVGCGINVGQKEIPDDLQGVATSLFLESNVVLSAEELLRGVLAEFEQYYDRFLQNETLETFADEYNTWLISCDKEVRVLDPKGEFAGISKGINDKGELLVQLADGSITEVYAGEVSVRGLYGYV